MTDTERLDWIEKVCPKLNHVHTNHSKWTVGLSDKVPYYKRWHTKPTLRESIDAAMKAEEQK